jgi:hypothetical protein
MKTLLRPLTVLVFAGLSVFAPSARAVVFSDTYWNFGSGGPPAHISTNVSGGTITAFNFDGLYTPAFNTANPSNGYSGINGNSQVHNASVEVKNFAGPINSLADATDPTATYFEFTLAPSAGLALQASAFELGSWSKPGNGPTTLTLVASTDNFTSNFTQLGSTTVSTGSWALASISFTTTTWATDTPVTFRIYGTDGTGGIGAATWRIDDVTFSLVAVPEPSTYASLLVGVVLLGARALRRRKSAVA